MCDSALPIGCLTTDRSTSCMCCNTYRSQILARRYLVCAPIISQARQRLTRVSICAVLPMRRSFCPSPVSDEQLLHHCMCTKRGGNSLVNFTSHSRSDLRNSQSAEPRANLVLIKLECMHVTQFPYFSAKRTVVTDFFDSQTTSLFYKQPWTVERVYTKQQRYSDL